VRIKFIDPETGQDRFLDSEETPVMVIFSPEDLKNVKGMDKSGHSKYLAFPEESPWTAEDIINWMKSDT